VSRSQTLDYHQVLVIFGGTMVESSNKELFGVECQLNFYVNSVKS